MLGRLESKYDETLMDYYVAFIAMCKRAAGMDLSEEEGKRRELFKLGNSFNPCKVFEC